MWVPAAVNLVGVRQMAWFQNVTVEATGKPAMIGSLHEAADLLSGTRGTIIEAEDRPHKRR